MIIIWGCGKETRNLIRYAEQHSEIFPLDGVCFTDSNPDYWGKKVYNYEIYSPFKLLEEYDVDILVINTQHYESILQCIERINHKHIKSIMSLCEYRTTMMARKAYEMRYKNGKSSVNNLCGKKSVVYTAIIGNIDELKEPLCDCKDMEYICFTDNRNLQSEKWKIEYVKPSNLDNRQYAKQFKLFPHKYLQGYDVSVWVDGKFQIKEDFKSYIECYGGEKEILLFPHFWRNCIYEEACECSSEYMADTKRMINQMVYYRNMGYPFQNGLYELGCIVRIHSDGFVQKLMDEWFVQQNMYSIRDQISLPFVLWNNNYLPDVSDVVINDNKWISLKEHKTIIEG